MLGGAKHVGGCTNEVGGGGGCPLMHINAHI